MKALTLEFQGQNGNLQKKINVFFYSCSINNVMQYEDMKNIQWNKYIIKTLPYSSFGDNTVLDLRLLTFGSFKATVIS